MRKIKNVSDYISSAPKESRGKLRDLRKCIKAAAPGTREELKWGNPTFSYKRILVAFAAYKDHINFMPTPRAIKKFSRELAKFKTGKGSIQFPFDKPLPLALIKKITKFRIKESIEKDIRWM